MSAQLNASDVFNLADFQTIETKVNKLKNLTTNTAPSDLSGATLVEYGDKTLVLELEKNCGAVGHSIMFDLTVSSPSKSGKAESETFNATAVIKASTVQDDGRQRYELTLQQFEEKQWNAFKAIFEIRQQEIITFLSTVKS